jgi:NAD(P)-dependent dehydrogenase (short-subunit alcohol dehydrogenase family)
MPALYEAAGAAPDDPRLTPVRLDLEDEESITSAAKAIVDAVGAPDAVVHNAAFVAVGVVEELPSDVLAKVITTNVLGPMRLTAALLPAMRTAQRGRIVVLCSQGGVRGMPSTSAYSASKGALERWAEALSHEVAPFGIGVSILTLGLFKTEVLTITDRYTDPDGPYTPLHDALDTQSDKVLKLARPASVFAERLAKVLETDQAPLCRHSVGIDALGVVIGARVMSGAAFQKMVRLATRIPRPNQFRESR